MLLRQVSATALDILRQGDANKRFLCLAKSIIGHQIQNMKERRDDNNLLVEGMSQGMWLMGWAESPEAAARLMAFSHPDMGPQRAQTLDRVFSKQCNSTRHALSEAKGSALQESLFKQHLTGVAATLCRERRAETAEQKANREAISNGGALTETGLDHDGSITGFPGTLYLKCFRGDFKPDDIGVGYFTDPSIQAFFTWLRFHDPSQKHVALGALGRQSDEPKIRSLGYVSSNRASQCSFILFSDSRVRVLCAAHQRVHPGLQVPRQKLCKEPHPGP